MTNNDITISGPTERKVTLTNRQVRLIRNICQQVKEGTIKTLQDFTARDANEIVKAIEEVSK